MDMMAMVSSMLAMQAAGTQQQIQTSIIKQNADAEKSAVQTLLGTGQSRPRRRRQSQYCGLKILNVVGQVGALRRLEPCGPAVPSSFETRFALLRMRSDTRLALNRLKPRLCRLHRGLDQLDGVVAGPFGGTGKVGDLAALAVDQHRGRHAQRLAYALKILKNLGF